ncbi:MAG: peptidase M48 [Rhodopirellula sp.]|nr:peptidase M48 [Rhodopirellula sp.]
MSQNVDSPLALKPLPYHEAIREYLKTEEPEIWQWYASNRVRAEQADAIRFELLKSTYRVDRDTQPELYAIADEVARRLSLTAAVTIYQAQNPEGLNASLAYVPGEAHLVLHGPVRSRLTEPEFRALVAHELSHLLLWQEWDGDYLVVDQILAALSLDPEAETPHFASIRLLRLYNEIFCDRGALSVAGDPGVCISMLVKIATGLDEVSPESYVRQAEEIFTKKPTKAAELTHPEAFIRARALTLWFDGNPEADAKIRAMIEGQPALDELDLLGQKQVAGLTRRLLDVLLAPKWFQSELVLAHARLFFDDYVPPEALREDELPADAIRTDDAAMQDYYCYVLLDFATADRDLEDLPLAAALTVADKLGLKPRFREIARKELRLRLKQLDTLDEEKEAILADAGQGSAKK